MVVSEVNNKNLIVAAQVACHDGQVHQADGEIETRVMRTKRVSVEVDSRFDGNGNLMYNYLMGFDHAPGSGMIAKRV